MQNNRINLLNRIAQTFHHQDTKPKDKTESCSRFVQQQVQLRQQQPKNRVIIPTAADSIVQVLELVEECGQAQVITTVLDLAQVQGQADQVQFKV